MMRRLGEAGLIWPAAFAIAVMAILIGLGAWQWQRLQWKEGLQRDLRQASVAAPVQFAALMGRDRAAMSEADWEKLRFRRVVVSGTFDHAHELHVWSPGQDGPAWSVVTPLRLKPQEADIAGLRTILVIRGVVSAASKAPKTRAAGQAEGIQAIIGRIRLDRPNSWANAPNIAKNEWFTRDLAAMATHLRRGAGALGGIAPVFIEAEQPTGGAGAPQPDLAALVLANRHLEYAMTWWGLAATLAGVFAVFASRRLRELAS